MAVTSFIRHSFLLVLLASAFLVCRAAPSTFGNGTSDYLMNDAGNITVQDSKTGDAVAQGLASDGAGEGSVIATLWAVYGLIIGIPLATTGLRLGRLTSGLGLGLALAVGMWACIVNTVDDTGISDGIVFAITLGFFALGFVLGLFMPEYGIGATALGMCGGLSIGMRLSLMREGLLIPLYTVNWIIICISGVAGVFLIIWRERMGVILGSTSAGTFLFILGIDLLVNKQNGMSRGLRYLFDRNSHHIADIFMTGYHPPISTTVLMCLSLVLIPLFYFAQHKLFPGSFRARKHRPSSMLSIASDRSAFARPSLFARLTGRKGIPIPAHAPDSSDTLNTDVEKHANSEGVNADSTTALITTAGVSDDEKVLQSPTTPSSALMQEMPEISVLLKGDGSPGSAVEERSEQKVQRT